MSGVLKSGWTWREDEVDRRQEHLVIHRAESGEPPTGDPVAWVGRSGKISVVVEFAADADDETRRDVASQLDTFVVEDNGADPWEYLTTWPGRTGNAYSTLRWSLRPGADKGGEQA